MKQKKRQNLGRTRFCLSTHGYVTDQIISFLFPSSPVTIYAFLFLLSLCNLLPSFPHCFVFFKPLYSFPMTLFVTYDLCVLISASYFFFYNCNNKSNQSALTYSRNVICVWRMFFVFYIVVLVLKSWFLSEILLLKWQKYVFSSLSGCNVFDSMQKLQVNEVLHKLCRPHLLTNRRATISVQHTTFRISDVNPSL